MSAIFYYNSGEWFAMEHRAFALIEQKTPKRTRQQEDIGD
jgi:hypothetical protein